MSPLAIAFVVLFFPAQSSPSLDQLKAADIPEGRRFPDQPKALVGVIGTPEPYSGDGMHLIYSVGFSPKGDFMAVAAGSTLRLWDLKGPSPAPAGELEASVVRGAGWAFTPDGAAVAVRTKKAVVLWDLGQRPPKKKVELVPEQGSAIAFTPDGSRLATAGTRTVEVWDLASAKPERKTVLEGHSKHVDRVAFSPSGKVLASASFTETLRLSDPETGEARHVLKGHSGHIWALSFSPKGDRLALTANSKSEEGKIRMWNLSGGEPKEAILKEHARRIRALAFTPDGAGLVSLGADGEVIFWSLADGKKVDRWKLPGEDLDFHSMALTADGRYLAVLHKDTRVYLFRLAA